MCESISMEDFKMEKYVFDEINGLWYELHGDYYLPCVTACTRAQTCRHFWKPLPKTPETT